ncbi:hypothetical protein, partial [Vibrio splendidus]|uniref:hypothetical protein n=1 Tax=Vibrio splendidus TaxID=29497 RepID=UPI003D146792
MTESDQMDEKCPGSKEANDLIKVERYKFILDKIKFLDLQLHNNLTITIKVLTGILTFLSASVLVFKENKIDIDTFIFSVKS